MADDRLTQLEIMAAHHERQIQDLSEIVSRQWQEIDALKRRQEKTQRQLIDVMAGGQSQPSEKLLSVAEIAAAEKPPHY